MDVSIAIAASVPIGYDYYSSKLEKTGNRKDSSGNKFRWYPLRFRLDLVVID